MSDRNAYAFSLTSSSGGKLELSQFAGKPILLVNTASKCGFTPQYQGLQALHTLYQPRGLTIIGMPCNDFGNQEPGSNGDIQSFCLTNYGVSFPISAKLHVKGPNTDPLFAWLGQQGGFLSRPRWNFYKYLIGPDGMLATWFSSIASPMSSRVQGAVQALLGRGQ